MDLLYSKSKAGLQSTASDHYSILFDEDAGMHEARGGHLADALPLIGNHVVLLD